MLEVNEIHTFYGTSHVLFSISLSIDKGESVALLGKNGMGKSTTMKSIIGLVRPRHGTIKFKGQVISGKPAFMIARAGIGYVPEDKRILGELTVRENLEVGARKVSGNGGWNLDKIYELFPVLRERESQMARTLSGGEQQMLAIARTLMINPELLLLDEPSQGLAPLLLMELGRQIRQLQESGISILLAEQNVDFALNLSSRVYVIEKGSIIYQGKSEELSKDESLMKRLLAV